MLELGEEHEPGHRSVGAAAAPVLDLLIVVGADARGIVEGALEAGLDLAKIHHVADADEALEVLRPRMREGDIILVKASNGIHLDRLVDQLRLELGEVAP